jgi:hypothetical protein
MKPSEKLQKVKLVSALLYKSKHLFPGQHEPLAPQEETVLEVCRDYHLLVGLYLTTAPSRNDPIFLRSSHSELRAHTQTDNHWPVAEQNPRPT